MADKKNEPSYIVGGKRYTPGKSTMLCRAVGVLETTTLYLTKKGAFFTVQESSAQEETPVVAVLNRDEALDFMNAHPAGIDQEAYAKEFGEPEEG